MFQSLIKPLTPCVHQAPFIICSFYTLYIYTFRRPLPMPCWMTVCKEEGTAMLDGRLLFSSWTLVDGGMGIASQVFGSSHLTFRSLSDCQVKCAEQLRTYTHLIFLPLAISETGKKKKCMLPSLSCAESEHPTRQNTWVCLTLFSSYLTSSCRPANWERELAPRFRQPDVLPDDVQRSRGFSISSRLSLTIVPPAGSQRSGRGQNKLSSIPTHRSTR